MILSVLPGITSGSMVNKPKIKGTAFESLVRDYLRQWWPNATRPALSGRKDVGDIINVPFVVEAKAVCKFALSEWMKELDKEKINAGMDVGFVVIKRTNQGVHKAYAVMEMQHMVQLLKEGTESDRDDKES